MSDLQEKLNNLASRLMPNRATTGTAPEPEPAPDTIPGPSPVEKVIPWAEGQSGATVNWDEYDIIPESVPLYKKAKFLDGKWLYPYDNYMTKQVTVGKLAETIEDTVNPTDWRLVSITPNGTGMVILIYSRRTIHELPIPHDISMLPPMAQHSVTDEAIEAWSGGNE